MGRASHPDFHNGDLPVAPQDLRDQPPADRLHEPEAHQAGLGVRLLGDAAPCRVQVRDGAHGVVPQHRAEPVERDGFELVVSPLDRQGHRIRGLVVERGNGAFGVVTRIARVRDDLQHRLHRATAQPLLDYPSPP